MRPASTRFSVVCPTYNRSRLIAQTLDSVRSQSVTDWELLVVSDGSTDDTEDWVRAAVGRDPRIRLIRTERHGHPSGPRNRGLAEARGEFIAYLDHDDVWHEAHLSALLTAFESGGDVVATGFELRDEEGRVTSSSRPLEMCWHPEIQALGAVFEPSRVAHRRGCAERVGGWRTGDGMEDWDLWLRLADAGARFVTVLDRTASLLDSAGTRRHHIAGRHHLRVAAFDNVRHAHAALSELRSGRHTSTLRAACAQDTRAWLRRMAASRDFVRPLGWNGDVEAELAEGWGEADGSWSELVLVQRAGRFELALPLACATVEHAERITAMVRRLQPAQWALIDEIIAACGAPGAYAYAPAGSGPV
ncbi:glycosyl transferase [Streptomyces paromomycinus]|uniref:Glycosyl transferase n=1 Tax=Streptomyces paromomycinus TaxID=92743 RepID=A0A401W5V5_STREY|nr:glycosyl transferase [Streptomyces paromomycinus]